MFLPCRLVTSRTESEFESECDAIFYALCAAAFCPLFRLHGGRQGGPSQEGGNPACGATNSANEVWMFGDEAEVRKKS